VSDKAAGFRYGFPAMNVACPLVAFTPESQNHPHADGRIPQGGKETGDMRMKPGHTNVGPVRHVATGRSSSTRFPNHSIP